ncbi:MAG: hypothetical protein RL660_1239 [Bacteroidota bacterium]|jgi:uncharacterized protein YbaP (TraB family)
MKRFFLLALVCFTVLQALAQDQQVTTKLARATTSKASSSIDTAKKAKPVFAKSLFWKVTAPNGGPVSYLYGTMHVSRKIAFNLPDTFYKAIQACDIVALESDPETWLSEMDKPGEVKNIMDFNDIGRTSSEGSYGYYGSANDLSYINKADLRTILLREPNEVNGLLFRSMGRNDNLEEDTYLDLFIFKAGKRYGKQIASLESVTESTRLSIIGNIKQMKDKKNRYSRSYNGNMGNDIEEAYRLRDINLLDSLQAKNSAEEYLTYFLHYRNDTMVNTLEALNKQGKRVFCAIGAAHLAGERGMLQSLKYRGYKVEPVMFEGNFNPATKIAELDEQYIPVSLSRKYSADSSMSFLTSAYCKGRGYGRGVNYLSSDMNNGVYYLVTRCQNFVKVNGQNTSDLFTNLDSLVFENTKGSVLTKERTTVAGYPAYIIISKTDEEDLIQQLFINTPLELVYMRVVGKKTFAEQQQAKKFIDSVRFNYRTQIVSTYERGYTQDVDVKMPVSIANEGVPHNNFFGKGLHLQGIDEEGGYYMLSRSGSYWTSGKIEEDTFRLAMFAEGLADRAEAKLTSIEFVKREGFPAAFASFTLKNKQQANAMFIIKGVNVYTLLTTTLDGAKKRNFYTSFKSLQEPNNFVKHVDTTLKISYVASLPRFGESASNFYRTNGRYDDESPDNFGRYWKDLKWHPYSNYGYQFMINSFELSKFEAWQNLDTFWKNVEKEIIGYDEMTVVSRALDTTTTHSLDIVYKDTACNTIVRAKAILYNNMVSVLRCGYDSTTLKLCNVDTVFNSFRYNGTYSKPMYITGSKMDTLLRLIASTDSADKKTLEENYKFMDVLPQEQSFFVNFLDTCKALRTNDDLEIVRFISDVNPKGQAMRNVMEKLYTVVKGNEDIAEAVLMELAEEKDSASIALFKKLLVEDPPTSGSNGSDSYEAGDYVGATASSSSSNFTSFGSVFTVFFDSLELAVQLMPELLQLLDYDEYKDGVVALTLRMLDKKLITLQQIEQRLPLYVQLAKRSYKSFTASESTLALYEKQMAKTEEELEENNYSSSNTYKNDIATYKTKAMREAELASGRKQIISYNRGLTAEKSNSDSIYYSTPDELCTYKAKELMLLYKVLKPYENKKQVADLLHKIDTCTHQDWLFCKAVNAIHAGEPADMSIIEAYAKMPDMKYQITMFARSHKKAMAQFAMPKTQLEWATCAVRSQLPERIKEDVKYLDKVYVSNTYGSGYVYVFSYKIDKEDELPSYAYYGMFSKDASKVFEQAIVHYGGIGIESPISYAQWLATLPMQIRVTDRKTIDYQDVLPWDRNGTPSASSSRDNAYYGD